MIRSTGDARSLLEGLDPPQRLGSELDRLGVADRPAQLAPVVVVSVNAERERAVSVGEGPHGLRMGEPAVEGDHRQGQVVVALAGMADQLVELDEPVGGPVEVGVVEEEGGAGRGRAPALAFGQLPQEMHERQQGGAATVLQPLAERLTGVQLLGGQQGLIEAARARPEGQPGEAREDGLTAGRRAQRLGGRAHPRRGADRRARLRAAGSRGPGRRKASAGPGAPRGPAPARPSRAP